MGYRKIDPLTAIIMDVNVPAKDLLKHKCKKCKKKKAVIEAAVVGHPPIKYICLDCRHKWQEKRRMTRKEYLRERGFL